MGRSPSFSMGLKKGLWTSAEDEKLVAYIQQHGHGSWPTLTLKAGLQRCGRSCRLRWKNYLRPDIRRGKFSMQEQQTIMRLHALLGNRWSTIASHLPMRTDNQIKNYWNNHLKKRLTKMGIDSVTHKSLTIATNLSHMTQWEKARLEAEARLAHDSKSVFKSFQRRNNGSAPFMNNSLMQPLLQPQPWCLNRLNPLQGIISYKEYGLKEPRPYIWTSDFFEKALSSLPNEHNQFMPITYLAKNSEPNFPQETTINANKSDCGTLNEPFNIFNNSEEAISSRVNELIYEDSYLMEAYNLSRNIDDEIHGNNIDQWSLILGEVQNNAY